MLCLSQTATLLKELLGKNLFDSVLCLRLMKQPLQSELLFSFSSPAAMTVAVF